MKISKLILIAALLLGVGYFSVDIYRFEREKRLVKSELIELSKIKYGLFSVDQWNKLVIKIISSKIEELNFDEANREKMRAEISSFLLTEIEEFNRSYRQEKSKTIKGNIQIGITDVTGVFEQLKKEIPGFTDDIIDFMNKPENKAAIQSFIADKVHDYSDETFADTDYSVHNEIIISHNFKNRDEAINGLKKKVESFDEKTKLHKIILSVLCGITGLFIVLSKRMLKLEYLIIMLICFFLLATGVFLPMIEIDARIANMKFTLLGESVEFQDQVLYYRNKSIVEVVRLMVTQSKIDLFLVGLMVFAFSVLFPAAKLISLILYLYFPKMKSNRIILFIIFKSGKWSMADVMVIAIFMAYIGFSGIISEQLIQIESFLPGVDTLTTNESNLKIGFYTFTAFVLLSLLSSHKLHNEISRELK